MDTMELGQEVDRSIVKGVEIPLYPSTRGTKQHLDTSGLFYYG